ncbi:putative Ig domain-containing protein, partial [bacterium]|nr:putative Ig domain-containing protein [bacterium]
HSVALKQDGTVIAWGSSSYSLNSVPAGLTDVIEISAGDYITAALKSDGQVVVWGSTSSDATVVPPAAQGTVQLAAGYGHILALSQAGNTVGWGNDWQGQISGPQARTDLVALAAGNNLSLGLTPDGQVHAWGWNAYEATKVPAGLDSVVRISAGSYSALATRSDGSLVAWGNNSNLQSAVPPGLGPVQMADGGYGHSVALVAAAPPEYFLNSAIQSVVGLPVSRQLSFSGTADRFSAQFLPPGLIFDPLTATLAGTPTRQGTYNVRFTAEKGFSRITRIITIHCGNPRRFEEWQAARLPGGAPSSHPLADPDGDSVSNLLEYALHRDPQVRETGSPVATSIADQSGQRYLTLTYDRDKDATDLRCLIEVSGDLVTWQSGPPATAVVSIIDHGDAETITVRDATPISSSQPRFIRLKVEQLATD